MRKGLATSCGCVNAGKLGVRNMTHSSSGSRLYKIYNGMRTRCVNANRDSAKYYVGKGISVCSEWLDFSTFKDWALANGYTDEMTIHRIDSSLGYSPLNCKWLPKGKHMTEDLQKYWNNFRADPTATRKTRWGTVMKGGYANVLQ